MIGVLLAATITASPFGTVTFAVRPCDTTPFRNSLPIEVSIAGVQPNGREVWFNSRYFARWPNRTAAATFDVSLPTGAYRYYLEVQPQPCTIQGYTAAIAGHRRHENASLFEGVVDPFTAAFAIGTFAWKGSASAPWFTRPLSCGARVTRENIKRLDIPHVLTIEDGAFYYMVWAPWSSNSSGDVSGVIRLVNANNAYYLKIPLVRPARSFADENGIPSIVRYDFTSLRIFELFHSRADVLQCDPLIKEGR